MGNGHGLGATPRKPLMVPLLCQQCLATANDLCRSRRAPGHLWVPGDAPQPTVATQPQENWAASRVHLGPLPPHSCLLSGSSAFSQCCIFPVGGGCSCSPSGSGLQPSPSSCSPQTSTSTSCMRGAKASVFMWPSSKAGHRPGRRRGVPWSHLQCPRRGR